MICRLAPQDYHRFHSPVNGQLVKIDPIPGQYFTVNPMAVRQNVDVYTENVRVIYYFETDFGGVAMVAIGAMLVGSIRTTRELGRIQKGDEIGYFAFGGSTLVVLFPRKFHFCSDLLENSNEQLETFVKMGDHIGSFK